MTTSRKAAGAKSKTAKVEKETLRDLKPQGEKPGKIKGGAATRGACSNQFSGCAPGTLTGV